MDKWTPTKGETVYVFSHKTRRVKKVTVESYIQTGGGAGAISIDVPFGGRGTYNMVCVGRTPEEALQKVLTRARAEVAKQQNLVEFLERKIRS